MQVMSAVRISSLLAACASLLVTSAVAWEDVISGLPTGAPTVSIPVVDVTGPYKGQRICYVCEFQDFPNVLAFFRGTGEETAELIVALNDLYVRNKDRDFKAVAMIVAGADASPWLEELAASRQLEIPLTVFRKGPADLAGRLYELNPEVENTFLVTLDRFVVANVAGIEPGEFGRVAEATERMLASLDAEAR
jgi:hypothetical protein